jgi:hypothetical protein
MASDVTGAFRTHLRYLEALAWIASDGHWKLSDAYGSLRSRLLGSPSCPRAATALGGSSQVQKSLANAWGTELLLLLSHRLLKGDEIVRVSNNWNAVQAYYALYHATQAVLVARGLERPESHPKTQKMFLDFWGRLPSEFAPWSFTFGPDGHSPASVVVDPSLHVWSMIDSSTCWSIACKALRTTRADAVAERFRSARIEKRKELRKDWLNKEEARRSRGLKARREPSFPLPLLTPGERNKAERSTRSYSVLDYLYRLRIRTNYVDSAMFTDGPAEPHESSSVRVSLLKIVCLSLLAPS